MSGKETDWLSVQRRLGIKLIIFGAIKYIITEDELSINYSAWLFHPMETSFWCNYLKSLENPTFNRHAYVTELIVLFPCGCWQCIFTLRHSMHWGSKRFWDMYGTFFQVPLSFKCFEPYHVLTTVIWISDTDQCQWNDTGVVW